MATDWKVIVALDIINIGIQTKYSFKRESEALNTEHRSTTPDSRPYDGKSMRCPGLVGECWCQVAGHEGE